MMKIKQFEVWIAAINPTKGAEPGKARPVIVIQTDLLNKHHPSSIICPITTNVQNESEILRVHLKKGSCGLNEDSDIMIDQVRAIDNKQMQKRIGLAPKDVIPRIKYNLKILFDI